MTDQVKDEQIEAWATELGDDHPAVKALRAERTARKASERSAKVSEIISRFPTAGLTADDFEGLSPDKFEGRAQRIAALSQSATPPAPTPTPEPAATPSPAEDAFARAAAVTDGVVPPVTEGKKLGRDEAWALMQRNPAEYERLRQAGRIDLGVTSEERGGSVIFSPGT